jgi:hypothetical protein
MKVVFLDIDGVLVTRRSLKERSGMKAVGEASCVEVLNTLLSESGAKIVISSAWRFCGEQEMKLILSHWGVRGEVVGMTPDLTQRDGESYIIAPRGLEIIQWLEEHPEIQCFLILDDCPMTGQLSDKAVKTQFETGLMPEHLEKARAILNA